jgi:hypothetical protein
MKKPRLSEEHLFQLMKKVNQGDKEAKSLLLLYHKEVFPHQHPSIMYMANPYHIMYNHLTSS